MLVLAKKNFSQHPIRLWLGKITKMFCKTALNLKKKQFTQQLPVNNWKMKVQKGK